jgi:ATP-dependent Lon protease
MMEMDQIDIKAASVLEGYLVRKDLVRTFSRQFPVPTYVVEFLLGRYCASTAQDEIDEGLEIVQRQLKSRTVKAGEEELFKAKALETGEVKIIDLVTARVDNKGEYVASLPSLRLTDVRISSELVNQHERMLTGGFYAEISVTFDVTIAQVAKGRPFGITSLREIQLSKRDVLDHLAEARKAFSTEEWKAFLLRSVGIEPVGLSGRQSNALLLRMVPFVERNYNMVELGPRGTGKSHLFQQVSPYAHLISGGKATVAKMFVENTARARRGLVCQYDVVCFDEVSGISFDQKDGVNIMKGYMESGEFSRGKESIRADGSIVLVGNFDVDVEHQQRIGHLFGPMPPEMKDDTAFMDRIHAFLPGWDVPKISKELLTNHFGLVSDFLSECWSQLRNQSRVSVLQNRVFFGGALSGRDTNAVNKTVSGLLKLLYPGEGYVADEDIEWAVHIAMEARRRVKEQQKRIGAAEFRNTHFSYVMGADGIEKFVSTPELQSENSIGGDPLEPGQVWTISPGGGEEHPGLYRIEINEGPGFGVKILNKPVPPAFKESIGYAEQNLYARSVQLVGDKDPRHHEFTVQLRAFDASKSGAKLGMASLLALCTALLKKSVRGGLIVVGEINLGGSIEPIHNPVTIAEIAVEKGATALLMPVACRRQLFDLSDDMATKIDIQFYADAKDALLKAIQE